MKNDQNLHFGAVMEEPTFSAREEEEEVEEEEEQALPGKEDLALRVDGTTSRERLMGITARVEGTTRPWYSKSLGTGEKWNCGNRLNRAGAAAAACFMQTTRKNRQSVQTRDSECELETKQKQPLYPVLSPVAIDTLNRQKCNKGYKLKKFGGCCKEEK